MRVVVAGATGVIGRAVTHRLVRQGNAVTGFARTQDRALLLRRVGVRAALVDVLQPQRVYGEIGAARPDVVIDLVSDLPSALEVRRVQGIYGADDRTRAEGTRNLVEAARKAGVARFIAGGIAWVYSPGGDDFYSPGADHLKDEESPLYFDAPPPIDAAIASVAEQEEMIVGSPDFDGLVLRFGICYGTDTWMAPYGQFARDVRQRRVPLVGNADGVFSFIHVDDAVSATLAAVDHGGPGVYNIVDDDPAPIGEWLPEFAAAIGAPAPPRMAVPVARVRLGPLGTFMYTEMRGSSNAKAKRELGWTPAHPSWRDGFRKALG